MLEIAGRHDANEFTADLLVGEDSDLRKARHPLIFVIQHFERAKSPAEGNLMLGLDILITKNQNLLLYEQIDNLIKEILVGVFWQVHVRDRDTELVRQRLYIQRHRFGLLYFSLWQIGYRFQVATTGCPWAS